MDRFGYVINETNIYFRIFLVTILYNSYDFGTDILINCHS